MDALLAVKQTNGRGEANYPISGINILKAHGKGSLESQLIKGYAINNTVAAQSIKTKITGAKIACLDMNLQRTRMALGVHIIIEDPNQLEDVRKREIDITVERIRKILDAGANVVLTTKGIDDLCLKPFVEAGAMAVRRVKKEDMKRIAKATGGLYKNLRLIPKQQPWCPRWPIWMEKRHSNLPSLVMQKKLYRNVFLTMSASWSREPRLNRVPVSF